MTTPVPAPALPPDIEAVLIPWLAAQFLAVYGLEVRTCAETPANLSDIVPVVAVARSAGADLLGILDRPVVDLDSFAAGRISASLLARQAHVLMTKYLGGVTGDAVVGLVNTVKGPGWLGYQDLNVHRCNATYEIYTHPLAA